MYCSPITEQLNNLQKDIVWMEEKLVQGEKVLVPVVYLASLDEENLKDGSQIIAGEDIALTTSGTLQNQGKIEAGDDLVVVANNIQNHGGIIEAKNDALLQSNTNIDNVSADIKAGNNLKLNAKKDINLGVATNQKTYTYKKGYQKTTLKGKDSIVSGKNVTLNAGENVKVRSSKIKVEEDALIVANKGNITLDTAKQKESFYFKVHQGYYKGNSLKNSGSNVEAKNLTVLTNGNLNVSGSTIKVKEDANIYAKDVNITSVQDTSYTKEKTKEKGFFSSSTKKKEKSSSTNIASLLQAKNVNIDTNSLTLIASKIKANQAQITAEIINLISSKDSETLSKFSDSSGGLTRTIATKGYIKEIAKEAKIEVSDKLIVNGKDITNQLSTDNILKTLSSEGKLTNEQINLVKAVLNNKEWNDKTTTLSGVGALIVAVVVAVCTAGAGAAVVGAAGTAAVGTTAAAVQAAVVQSLVTGVTNQLVTSAVTGNSFKLDTQSLVKGAVSAGVLKYAGELTQLGDLNIGDTGQQIVQTTVDTTVQTGLQSAVYGTDFEDNLVFNAVNAVGAKASNIIGENYQEGSLNYFSHKLAHAVTGAATAELMGKDGASGAIGAVAGEVIGEGVGNSLIQDGEFSDRDKDLVRLSSQLGTIAVAGLTDKDVDTALNSSNVAVENNLVTIFSRKVAGGVANHLFGVVTERENGKPDMIFSLGDNGSLIKGGNPIVEVLEINKVNNEAQYSTIKDDLEYFKNKTYGDSQVIDIPKDMTQHQFDELVLKNAQNYDVNKNLYPNIFQTISAGIDNKIFNDNNSISNNKNSNTYIDNVIEQSGGWIKDFYNAPLQNAGEYSEKINNTKKGNK